MSVLSVMNIIKIVQLFIICILTIEFFSFLFGYGTHFETYKFIVLISIMVFNVILKKIK